MELAMVGGVEGAHVLKARVEIVEVRSLAIEIGWGSWEASEWDWLVKRLGG